jgi:hypothetical protein
MLKKIIDFFTGKKPAPAEPVDTWQPAATAPYKVPEPAATTPIPDIPSVAVPIPYRFQSPAIETTNTPPVAVLISPEPIAAIPIPFTPANEPPKCGCGRSSTGFCVGLHKLSPEAWADHPNNPATVGKIVAAPAQPEKKKRTFVKKPAVAKAAKPVVKAAAIKAPAKPRAKKPQ